MSEIPRSQKKEYSTRRKEYSTMCFDDILTMHGLQDSEGGITVRIRQCVDWQRAFGSFERNSPVENFQPRCCHWVIVNRLINRHCNARLKCKLHQASGAHWWWTRNIPTTGHRSRPNHTTERRSGCHSDCTTDFLLHKPFAHFQAKQAALGNGLVEVHCRNQVYSLIVVNDLDDCADKKREKKGKL